MSQYQQMLEHILGEFRKAGRGGWEEVLKTVSTSSLPGTATAYQPWNLDLVGHLLLPQRTPLQNIGAYSVKTGETGDNREYRAITGKNSAKSGGRAIAATSAVTVTASQLGRAKLIDYDFLTKKKQFEKFAPEGSVTWELYNTSGPFNALGSATIASLINAKELEERHMLGACSTALGATATPTGTPSNSGGSLTNAASPYTVTCAALNYYGWWFFAQDGLPAADQVAVTTYGMAATAMQGVATPAASAGITIAAGSTGSIAMVVAPKKGAFGYVWFIKHSAGTYTFGGVSTQPYITIRAEGAAAVATPAATTDGSGYDNDGYPVVWDGLFAQIVLDADIPGEYVDCNSNTSPGALTTTGAGSGIAEFETIFQNLAIKTNLSPDLVIVSPRTLATISNTAIGSSAPAYRLLVDAEKTSGEISAGTKLGWLHNQYMGTVVTMLSHPLFPDGKAICYTKKIDYPDARVSTNLELHCVQHFLQDFFARISDVAPMGPWAIKTYGAPTLYWPRSCGVIDNIA